MGEATAFATMFVPQSVIEQVMRCFAMLSCRFGGFKSGLVLCLLTG